VVYLADTSAWRRSHAVDRWAELLDAELIVVCPPVELELLHSSRGPADFRERRRELAGVPSLPLDRAAVATALRRQGDLAARSRHLGPTAVDLLVAAIAEVNATVLLHYDRHFDAIAGVTGQAMEWVAPRGSLA
jgi:predicted nucleic acid-binding protein